MKFRLVKKWEFLGCRRKCSLQYGLEMFFEVIDIVFEALDVRQYSCSVHDVLLWYAFVRHRAGKSVNKSCGNLPRHNRYISGKLCGDHPVAAATIQSIFIIDLTCASAAGSPRHSCYYSAEPRDRMRPSSLRVLRSQSLLRSTRGRRLPRCLRESNSLSRGAEPFSTIASQYSWWRGHARACDENRRPYGFER